MMWLSLLDEKADSADTENESSIPLGIPKKSQDSCYHLYWEWELSSSLHVLV